MLQLHVEPLTAAAKVSLALYGHNHRRERISAAFNNRTVLASIPVEDVEGVITHVYERPTATVHYIAGTGGAGFTVNDCASEGCATPEWSENTTYVHGYLRFNVTNATHMYYEYVSSIDRTVVDRMLIIQDLTQPWVRRVAA